MSAEVSTGSLADGVNLWLCVKDAVLRKGKPNHITVLVAKILVIFSSLQHQLTTSTWDLLLTPSKLPAKPGRVRSMNSCGRGMQMVPVCHRVVSAGVWTIIFLGL